MKNLLILIESVVGEYEFTNSDGDTFTQVFLDNGIMEWYANGRNKIEYKWSIVDGEIHVNDSIHQGIWIYRINKDSSIIHIAYISKDGKRTDYTKQNQQTWKKIK